MIRSRIAAAGALVLLAVAGCTDPATDTAAQTAPSAAASALPGAVGPVDTSCKPRESLRPTGSLPAPGALPAGSYMAEIRKRGRLVLGTSQDTLLFSSRNPFTGKIEGFDVDMGRQIAQAIFGDPDKIQIKVIGYDKRVDDAADGTVDLVADTMTINCDRWKKVNFSTVYYDAGQRVLVAAGSPAKSVEDLGGKKVCAARGSTSLTNISTVPKAKLIPYPVAAFADCLVAFQRNEIDGISTDDVILAGLAAQDPYAKVIGPRFTQEPYGIATSNEHPEFTRFVNQVLAANKANGTWKATYDKWLGAQFGAAPAPPIAEYR
ncbi:MAG: polar amino acid transport system substrate-binding protein [Actinoplanes sp.]|nr:polar amino acid transport system substrate-binding protein [Actinoplanes sp.]